jgi:putative ABC transport system permease protein
MFRDLRFAARGLMRARVMTTAAVLTVALGTGAASSMFAIVNAVLIRPLPYPRADDVAVIWAREPGGGRTWLSAPEIADLKERATSLEAVAGLTDLRFALTGEGEPEEIEVVAASPVLFTTLAAAPSVGRLLSEADDQPRAAPVVVLSHGLWTRRFGGLPDVVGKTILLDGRTYTVAGVMQPGFSILPPSPVFPARVDAWVALTPHLQTEARDVRYLHAVARIRHGLALEAARQEVAAVGSSVSREFGTAYGGRLWSFDLVPMQEEVLSSVRPALTALMWTVALVQLIACANVAALLLARAEARRRETAVRAAIGASRMQIVRSIAAEAVLLAAAGATGGVVLASLLPDLLGGSVFGALPRFGEVAVDWRVVLFSAAAMLGTVSVFTLVPALLVTSGAQGLLRASTRSPAVVKTGRFIVAAEIALASTVLVVALVLVGAFARALGADPGFVSQRVLTARVTLPPTYRSGADVVRFLDNALGRIRALPGVQHAGAVSQLPFSNATLASSFMPDDSREVRVDADLRSVTPEYFAALGIAVVRGRALTDSDNANAPAVAVVDERLANRLWPGLDAIGRRIRWVRQPDSPLEVVGVVRSVRHRAASLDPRETVYRPAPQYVRYTMFLAVRTAGNPSSLAADVVAAVHAVDAGLPVADVATMDARIAASLAPPGLGALLGGGFAVLALALAAAGVYGMLAFQLSQRTRELGIRLALGSRPRRIVSLVIAEGTALVVGGLVMGLAAAAIASRWIGAHVPGADTGAMWPFAVAAPVMLVVALAACWLPARRASRIDPAAVLRSE